MERIKKSLVYGGIKYGVGEVVSLGASKNYSKLLDSGYLLLFNEPPHTCPQCDRMFATADILKHHDKITHIGGKKGRSNEKNE